MKSFLVSSHVALPVGSTLLFTFYPFTSLSQLVLDATVTALLLERSNRTVHYMFVTLHVDTLVKQSAGRRGESI